MPNANIHHALAARLSLALLGFSASMNYPLSREKGRDTYRRYLCRSLEMIVIPAGDFSRVVDRLIECNDDELLRYVVDPKLVPSSGERELADFGEILYARRTLTIAQEDRCSCWYAHLMKYRSARDGNDYDSGHRYVCVCVSFGT